MRGPIQLLSVFGVGAQESGGPGRGSNNGDLVQKELVMFFASNPMRNF